MGVWVRLALVLVLPVASGCSIRSQHDLIQSESLIHKFLYDQWTLEEIEDRYESTRADTRDLIQRLREVRKRNQQLYRELKGELAYESMLERRREEIARLKGIAAGLEKEKERWKQKIDQLRADIEKRKKAEGQNKKGAGATEKKPKVNK